MKQAIGFTCILTLLFIVPTHMVQGQQILQEGNFWDNASITVSTSLLLKNNNAEPAYHHFSEEQSNLFNNNPNINLGIDYALTEYFHIRTGLAYTTSQFKTNSSLMFVIPPPDDALTHFQTSYRFHSFTFEPNALLQFNINDWAFFWSAGPVISTSFLNTDIDGATYGNPNSFQNHKEKQSSAIGVGVQASTGVHYFFHQNVGLNIKIGYKYLTHQKLHTVIPIDKRRPSLNYRNNTFINRIGLIFKL